MTQTVRGPLYHRHRFPAEVMAQAVWLYLRFPLSLRITGRETADVIAVIATPQNLFAERIAGKALRTNKLPSTRKELHHLRFPCPQERADPEPTAIRQLVDKAHEAFNSFIVKSKRN